MVAKYATFIFGNQFIVEVQKMYSPGFWRTIDLKMIIKMTWQYSLSDHTIWMDPNS